MSPAVKRLSKEILLLEKEKKAEPDAFRDYVALPLEENLFEWHFTVRGPRETEFEGGKYHGKIVLPPEYPFKPPSILFLTPNGRFELNKKICLSITGFHPEYWQPAWDIRSVLLAVISMFPTKGDGAIGALYQNEGQRRALAKASKDWICPACGSHNNSALPDPKPGETRPPRRQNAVAAERDGDKNLDENKDAPVRIPGLSFAYEGEKSQQGGGSRQGQSTGSEAANLEAVQKFESLERASEGVPRVVSNKVDTASRAIPVGQSRPPSNAVEAGGFRPRTTSGTVDGDLEVRSARPHPSTSLATMAMSGMRTPGRRLSSSTPAVTIRRPTAQPDAPAAAEQQAHRRVTTLIDFCIVLLVTVLMERLARRFL